MGKLIFFILLIIAIFFCVRWIYIRGRRTYQERLQRIADRQAEVQRRIDEINSRIQTNAPQRPIPPPPRIEVEESVPEMFYGIFDRVYQMPGITGFSKKVEDFKNKAKEQSEKKKVKKDGEQDFIL